MFMYYQTINDCENCDIDTMKMLKCNCFIDKFYNKISRNYSNSLKDQLDHYKIILLKNQ